MSNLKLLLIAALLPVLIGCAGMRPVARTMWDAALIACAVHHSQAYGLTVDEAATRFCCHVEQLRPWLDVLLRQSMIQAQRDERIRQLNEGESDGNP